MCKGINNIMSFNTYQLCQCYIIAVCCKAKNIVKQSPQTFFMMWPLFCFVLYDNIIRHLISLHWKRICQCKNNDPIIPLPV